MCSLNVSMVVDIFLYLLPNTIQDMTNSGLWYLCQVAGGFKDGLNAKLFKVRN